MSNEIRQAKTSNFNAENKLAVEMANMSKAFGNVQALDNVSFRLNPGEIRSLVGENGAGKTTLMNILYGMYQQDEGNIKLWGEEVPENWSPNLAIKKGIGMIHQHFSLIPNHTALENIVMPLLEWTDITPSWHKIESEIKELCAEYNFQVDLKAQIEDLSMGERQQVEILKALYQGASVLILDEPTSVLTPQQSERLFEFLKELRSQGHSVVLVTHKLDEAIAISDRITVLRDGKHIGTIERDSADPQKIARMMVERDWISTLEVGSIPDNANVLLEVNNLTVESAPGEMAVEDISFQIKSGEIVGLAGVAGNGQVHLAEALIGLRRLKKGEIKIENNEITGKSVAERKKKGLVYIPEDKHHRGVVLDMNVAENIVLEACRLEPFSKRGILNAAKINEEANKSTENYNIKTPSCTVPVKNLSGGNQQKVVLARALLMNPSVIIACEPTRGLDFNAMEYIRKKLIECAENGMGILLISSDLDEILELSHRIMVIFKGKIVGQFTRGNVDIEKMGLMMVGHEAGK